MLRLMAHFSAIAVLVQPSRRRRRTSAQSCTSYTLPRRVGLTRGLVVNCQRRWTAQFSTGVTRAHTLWSFNDAVEANEPGSHSFWNSWAYGISMWRQATGHELANPGGMVSTDGINGAWDDYYDNCL